MKPIEKVEELLTKINGAPLCDWHKSSQYAQQQLKTKCKIVIDEILFILQTDLGHDPTAMMLAKYWERVLLELKHY